MSRQHFHPHDACVSATRRLWLGALALLLTAVLLGPAHGTLAADSADATELLKQADALRTSKYAEFTAILESLEGRASQLTAWQRQYLRYLQGYLRAYDGDYAGALTMLKSVIDESRDVTLRFRAIATIVNVQTVATQYQEAFVHLTQMLALLPEVTDKDAREQGLGVVAFLYNQVGEYDLALSYAQELVDDNWGGRGACNGAQLKLEALYKSGRQKTVSEDFGQAIDACLALREFGYANVIRTYVARIYLAQRRFGDAIRLLKDNYEEVQQTRYPRLISEYDALLAQAYRETGDASLVRHFASRAIRTGVKDQYTEPLLAAYRLLYLLAKEQEDSTAALAFHEKYAAADKGYLDDVSARQLAYQRVNHDAIASKLQIDALNKQNEVLQLQQALNKKGAEASRLYITLLLMLIAFILLWAYRTKRSQLHFMKLSRIDGLTGVANRPYFIEEAERALDNSRKLQQEVCIVLCDLDHFKQINDKYGHATGDFVLKQTVTACRLHLRESDIFGRFGGEEFGVLLPGCNLADARARCEQLRIAIAEVAKHPGSMVANVSASFGLASSSPSGYELRQLLAHADAALYRAKRAGRNLVVAHDAKDADDSLPEITPDQPVRGVV